MVAENEFEHSETAPIDPLTSAKSENDRSDLPARVVSARVLLRPRLKEIWRSRELILFLIRKELKVKYKGSFLGFIWSMINPAIVLLVYYVVFKYFLRSAVPYFALYLFSGLLVWNFFGVSLGGASSAIVRNAGIVKKVSFPREILAISQVLTSLVFFFFQFLVLVLFLIGFHYAPAWGYLPLLLGGLIDLVIVTAALSIFLSAVNVYLRDVQHLIDVVLQAWFWGVPIIYSYNRVYHHSHWFGYFFLADPITPIVLSFQRALYGHVAPLGYSYAHGADGPILANYPYHFYLLMLGWVFVMGVVLLLISLLVFGRLEGNFAEEL